MKSNFFALVLLLILACSEKPVNTETNNSVDDIQTVSTSTVTDDNSSDVITSDYRDIWKENNKKMFFAICKLLKGTPGGSYPTTYSFLAEDKWYEWYLSRFDIKFQQGTEFEKRRILSDANLKSELETQIDNTDLNRPIRLGVVSAEADKYNFESKEYVFAASPLTIPGLEIQVPPFDKNYEPIVKLDENQAEELEKVAERGFLGGVSFKCDVYHQFYLQNNASGNPAPLTKCIKVTYYSNSKKVYEQTF
jgi:hypothetical protein